ncbi:DUF4329 domain-containing protein [Stenotrophomonas sp. Sm3212]|uniref:DUF4329 domain-containing protein n=1 Tax=Stenotrophomonas TaxID=40323 RepID=UPI001312FD2C|nr:MULTISPECIES: DUF4329 domain-containing protein [Stenotrophomonas]ELF4110049.1 DUF4329 domain-containing protein [Stenotrophomonas maltophilia]MBA0288065.1 DUF4329 domain-containing protein [Stenotrophomonas maltophilia]MBA0326412.1 DUF4329 domain-containing protein [Stenotrophomonas maltophilia]MBA0355531.1 DUF4329 domain-containing protein [Stenotrophomonas maltophilia]MBH1531786.1 DUF4329 domain-containing protein [Stenotrophomonas maltophilia]
MNRFALALASFASLAFATAAVAGEVEKVAVPNVGTITYEHLFDAVSEANEGLDDFMARISPRLRAFSDETGFEACGVVARNDEGRFAVAIGTNHSHVACVNFASKVPQGFQPTMETIHSHGGEKTFAASATDIALLGKDAFGSRSRTSLRVTGQNLHMFSKTDYHGGAGYLATPNGAIYQNGPKSVREVAAR